MSTALTAVALTAQIVFFGDSITKGWELTRLRPTDSHPVKIEAEVGIATPALLAKSEAIARLYPYKLFIMAGINEIDADPERITASYKKIIAKILEISPYTKVYVQSVLPTRQDKIPPKRIVTLNNSLKQMSNSFLGLVRYIDLYPSFLDSEGKLASSFTEDGLHLTSNGYSLWKKKLIAYLP